MSQHILTTNIHTHKSAASAFNRSPICLQSWSCMPVRLAAHWMQAAATSA